MTKKLKSGTPFVYDENDRVVGIRDPHTGTDTDLVTAVTSPGGGIGIPALRTATRDRLADVLEWCRPVHRPILDPLRFVGMSPIVASSGNTLFSFFSRTMPSAAICLFRAISSSTSASSVSKPGLPYSILMPSVFALLLSMPPLFRPKMLCTLLALGGISTLAELYRPPMRHTTHPKRQF